MKRHWYSLALFLALTSAIPMQSQTADNMVFNPSFEEHRQCPEKIDALGVMREADAWWQPTGGSSDYFNACGGRECNVPRNKMGFQEAHSGHAYCGIYCSQEDYREYLQTELKTPLSAGKHYQLRFWTSLADKSPYAIVALGALFTKERPTDSTHGILMRREVTSLAGNNSQSIATFYMPQVSNTDGNLLDNTREWVEISGEFVAEGGEKYLTIGNFLPFNKSFVVVMQGSNLLLPGAYYYIDDVSLVCLDTTVAEKPIPQDPMPVGTIVPMWDILFATDESEILQQSYNELFRLKAMLEENPGMTIELRGHTDSQGSLEYNQRLSEARAKAVTDFLINQGIDKRRLSWKGFGKTQPVSDNDTAEGRRKNRRVEYRIISY